MYLNPPKEFKELTDILNEVHDLKMASNILYWDQNTQMPEKGFEQRGRQLSTLGKCAHEKFTQPEVGRLLDKLIPYEESLEPLSNEASLLRVARREYYKNVRVPAHLITKILSHQSACMEKWIAAKEQNNFELVRPYLEKTVELSKEYCSFFHYNHIADPLISENDEGFNTKDIQKVFEDLKKELVPLVQTVVENFRCDDSFMKGTFERKNQESFGHHVVEKLGYDFARGRIDTTHHPFMISFAHGDVRITTRYRNDDVTDGLFSLIHETGHALYEMGISKELDGSLLFNGTSSGVHESQSRLWENIVGRSVEFWNYFFPIMKNYFPGQFDKISLNQMYKALNKVSRSLIRTDADELTYNLHVMIRFECELKMLEGKLSVKDLPQAWNHLYESYLGVKPLSDKEGCLQDIHWYASFVGGQFQGYTLGNIMSAQFYNSALKAHPNIVSDVSQGNFDDLRSWLQKNVHVHGKKLLPQDLLVKSTGEKLNAQHYITYLKNKFLPLCA